MCDCSYREEVDEQGRQWDAKVQGHEFGGQEPITLASLRRIHLQPGDVLVLETPQRTPDAGRARLAELMKQAFPEHTCIIADGGMKVSVFRVGVEDEGISNV